MQTFNKTGFINKMINPVITGDFILRNGDISHLTLPEYVLGNLIIENCVGLQNLPHYVGESLYMSKTKLNGANFPEQIGKNIDLSFCGDLQNIKIQRTVYGFLDLRFCIIKNVTMPELVCDFLDINGCDMLGVSIPFFKNLRI